MTNRIVAGIVAGATGTLALNVATYLDMLVRGRPASQLPSRVAGRLADEIGVPLDLDGSQADEDGAGKRADNRAEALGALLGYGNGIGIGIAYGLARVLLPRPPLWIASAALGAAAMASSDYPATRLGLTDPQTWSGADWMADVLPHMAYGIGTAFTFEQIRSR